MPDYFALGRRLEREGKPFVTATVVRVEKPTAARPGDKAIVTLDGEVHGWVGGSCAKPSVLEEAALALREDRSRLVRLSPEPADSAEIAEREGITDLAMTCFSGGTMEIFIEPHQPKSKLTVIGDQPVARALAKLGEVMGFEVGESLEGGEDHPLHFIVIATHGTHDEVSLETALASRAPYVGLVASPKRAGSIREYLGKQGLDGAALERLRAPAGLDIQARSPEEIAVSIVAEIVQVRRNLGEIDWGSDAGTERTAEAAEKAAETIDPVCGMAVAAEGSAATHRHNGSTYYFCCVGCREKFAADPDSYLTA